jgi:hypothetical protein
VNKVTVQNDGSETSVAGHDDQEVHIYEVHGLEDVVLCTCRIYPTVNTSDRPRLIVITIRTIITRNPTMASIKATNKIIADTVRENKLNSNLH